MPQMGSKAPSPLHLVPRGYVSCVNCGAFKFSRFTNYTEDPVVYAALRIPYREAIMFTPSTGLMEVFYPCGGRR
jgi:hypothetical protein